MSEADTCYNHLGMPHATHARQLGRPPARQASRQMSPFRADEGWLVMSLVAKIEGVLHGARLLGLRLQSCVFSCFIVMLPRLICFSSLAHQRVIYAYRNATQPSCSVVAPFSSALFTALAEACREFASWVHSQTPRHGSLSLRLDGIKSFDVLLLLPLPR